MDTANVKKRYIMIPLLFLCLLLCGCHGNIIGNLMASEHTELLVDGEYKPFNVPRNMMEALMKLVEAKDADTIYEVFSPEVRENAEGLYGQVQEFIRCIEEDVTSGDCLSGYGTGNRSGGSAKRHGTAGLSGLFGYNGLSRRVILGIRAQKAIGHLHCIPDGGSATGSQRRTVYHGKTGRTCTGGKHGRPL